MVLVRCVFYYAVFSLSSKTVCAVYTRSDLFLFLRLVLLELAEYTSPFQAWAYSSR